MASLSEQLKQVKLKKLDKTKDVKDFSDPKLAGFTSEQEISDYQLSVLDVNTERWLECLSDLTFPTAYCPLTLQHANMFIQVYEKHYKDKDPSTYHAIKWRCSLVQEDSSALNNLEHSLQTSMDTFLQHHDHVFVKTSSRSAKDAPMYDDTFRSLYRNELKLIADDKRTEENEQITCLLTAAFKAMRMTSASEVIDMFMTSERIYQDMLLAVEQKQRFHENFVVRQFVDIDVDMEFRGFVHEFELTALSQYNYLIHSQRLNEQRDKILELIKRFYYTEVKPKLEQDKFVDNFIIDFAVCNNEQGQKLWVIEINPFLETTDGALFSWQHERHLLEGRDGACVFRITEKCRPGAKTMLPYSVRKLLEEP